MSDNISKINNMSSKNEINDTANCHFITDQPVGIDLFEGKSQERIAKNVIQFIQENETSKRKVIGIDGEWGSGKSNLIEIIKNKLTGKYYFFIFDAWGHQEDLTRRSILEGLLDSLVNKDKILTGKSKSNKKWVEELDELLAKKKHTKQTSIPKISLALVLSFIGLILFPVFSFLAQQYLKSYTDLKISLGIQQYINSAIILLIPFSLLIIYILILLFRAKFKGVSEIFSKLFYIYKGKDIETTSCETISEEEPTVREFTNFLAKIESGLKIKLVIVFDNMDRLPAKKVKEIWSTIHTFFSSEGNSLSTWAIVPYDNAHICSIFNEDDKKEKVLADSYIHKTFSIVFHIPPPILSDWKVFFVSKFKEAFGFDPPSDQFLEVIYDYHNSSCPKIKPRDIICFINDIVALKKLWDEEIPLKYLALFALKRASIMQNPSEIILNKNYLGNILPLFESDENLEMFIAALAFNVPIDKADEILLKPVIDKVIKGEGDLSKVSSHKSFITVFNSVFLNSNPEIINCINCLNDLPDDKHENSSMSNYWKKLSEHFLKIEKLEIKHIEPIKKLLRRLKDNSLREIILKALFSKAISVDKSNKKLFAGDTYANFIKEIEQLLLEIWKDKSVLDFLPDNNVEAEEYFYFIDVYLENYQKYKVYCDITKVNAYLIDKFTNDKISEHISHIKVLRYTSDLKDFKDYISNLIPTLTPNLPNVQIILENIYRVDKAVSTNNKNVFIIPDSISVTLLPTLATSPCAIDLLFSIISANNNVPNNALITTPHCTKLLANNEHLKNFIANYEFYMTYEDLIVYTLTYPSLLTKNAIIELTNNNFKVVGKNAKGLLAKYSEIKTQIFSDDVNITNNFIQKINTFYSKPNNSLISEVGISNSILIIKDNSSVECDLIADIISHSNKFIDEISHDVWVSSMKEGLTSENIVLFNILLSINKYHNKKLPNNANSAYSSVLSSIAKKEISIPADKELWDKFYEMFGGSYSTTFKNIRDEFLNPTHAAVTIEELDFFEKGLFKHGNLNYSVEISNEILRRILIPLANEATSYVTIIKKNSDAIIKIIEKANDSITEFKNALEENCKSFIKDLSIKHFLVVLYSKYFELLHNDTKNEVSVYSGAFNFALNIRLSDKDAFWELYNNHALFSKIQHSEHENKDKIEHFTFQLENINPLIQIHFESFLSKNNVGFQDSKIR